MSEEARALIVAGITGPFAIFVDRVVSGFMRRRRDDAQVDLTVSETWQTIVAELRRDISDLRSELAVERGRVDEVKDDLKRERDRAQGLEAEVDKYRSIARSLLRHVLRLREVLGKTGVEMPPIPQDVEDALTGVELP